MKIQLCEACYLVYLVVCGFKSSTFVSKSYYAASDFFSPDSCILPSILRMLFQNNRILFHILLLVSSAAQCQLFWI